MCTAISPERALRILLVEDVASVRESLAECLREEGHQVDVAAHGREGFERFCAGRYDVVISDRSLPYLDGDHLSVIFKRLAPETRVILLSGIGALVATGGEWSARADLCLEKPVSLHNLRQALAKVTCRSNDSRMAA